MEQYIRCHKLKLSYIDKKTIIHQLHPASKILWVISILIGSIIINDPFLLFLLFLSTLPFVFIGKILKEWSSFIKLALWLSIIIIFINIFASQNGSTILYTIYGLPIIGSIKITFESILFSIGMSLRMLSTISAFAIFTLTINPDDLLQTILMLKFPHKTVLTTTIAIRFIPCLLKDLETLQNSVKTRGYQMNEGRFFRRIKKKAILIQPLLSNSLERSIQSAEAMESKGFGSIGKKTFYKKIQTTNYDYFIIILSLSLIPFFISMWIFDIGKYNYYPIMDSLNVTIPYLIMAFIMVFLISAPITFSPIKKAIDLD